MPMLAQANERAKAETSGVSLMLSGRTANFTLPGGIKLEMVTIPAGTLHSESPVPEPAEDEEPGVPELMDRPVATFLMGKIPVTQGQWMALMRYNPSKVKGGPGYPVTNVDWTTNGYVQVGKGWERDGTFLAKLNEITISVRPPGKEFRLPTEAEWEYAYRAGTKTIYFWGNEVEPIIKYAWCMKNSDLTIHPVGQKLPNDWGLHDMAGNIKQWCFDWYKKDWSSRWDTHWGPAKPLRTQDAVVRGSDCDDNGSKSTFESRSSYYPTWNHETIGFRLVLADPIHR